jgi:hypothetical protein
MSVAYGNNTFVAVGNNGIVLSGNVNDQNKLEWKMEHIESHNFYNVIYTNNKFMLFYSDEQGYVSQVKLDMTIG